MKQIEESRTADSGMDDFAAAHGQALLVFAFLLTGGDRGQAEDLVQTVLARLVERGLHDLDNPRAYARRSIVNEYATLGRRASAQQRVLTRWSGGARDRAPASDLEDRLAVLDTLQVLTERERAVVVLRYYEDLPDEEIAEVVGCSRSTVRSLVHRAMPKLRAGLGATYGQAEPSTAHVTEGRDRDA